MSVYDMSVQKSTCRVSWTVKLKYLTLARFCFALLFIYVNVCVDVSDEIFLLKSDKYTERYVTFTDRNIMNLKPRKTHFSSIY